MELYVKIVNSYKRQIFFSKHSILDVLLDFKHAFEFKAVNYFLPETAS